MNEWLLKKHLQETPRMTPQDTVKLAFQSAFGCGHLLSARELCADFVRRELTSVPEDVSASAFTPIGGCLCRLNLASPAVRALTPERIADLMVLTDEHVRMRKHNEQHFEETLSQLGSLAQAGQTPFSADALASYLKDYRALGCPPVSHSEDYRHAYRPAYRVVLTDLAVLLPVMTKIDLESVRTIVIDGLCGSGKTTLAGMLGRLYGTRPIPMDDFFLPFEMRTPDRLAQPGGNVHHERFSAEILDKIKAGEPLAYRRFDCRTGSFLPRAHEASDLVIIEGSYSHHPAFDEAHRRMQALRVFVETDAREQLRRIGRRDPALLEVFRTRWIPLEKTYFEAYDIKDQADLVITSQRWLEDEL